MEQVLSSSPAVVSDTYPMFIEPMTTRVPSGFSGYIWLDTKILLKKDQSNSWQHIIIIIIINNFTCFHKKISKHGQQEINRNPISGESMRD